VKTYVKQSNRNLLGIAALAALLIVGSVSAFAMPANQVARTVNVQTITAKCCVLLNPTVRVTEPATPTPVIVTWSADYNTTGTAQFGLSVNGGACVAYGPFVVQQPVLGAGANSVTVSGTHQWVVSPSDGLVKGSNTFQVCGGGSGQVVTVNIGFSTLTVQIGK